jgi:beta-lactamase class A
MMELYRQAAEGCLSLDDALPVVNEFRSIADGSPYSLSAADDSDPELYALVSQSLPIRELTERMITWSSNLATNLLIERVTAEKVNEFMRRLGTRGITVRRGVEDGKAFALGLNNAATARGLAHVLRRLARGEAVSPQASEEMIGILTRQHFNDGIPGALPERVVVAHKTGWINNFYHDAGVVYPPEGGPYVLVVMTQGLAEDREAPELVSAISKMIYENQYEWRHP